MQRDGDLGVPQPFARGGRRSHAVVGRMPRDLRQEATAHAGMGSGLRNYAVRMRIPKGGKTSEHLSAWINRRLF